MHLLDNPDVNGIVLTIRDVTGRRTLEDQLRHQAFHDALTGLSNRALFLDRVEHALARIRRADSPIPAVAFIDLDDFKLVNDSLGPRRRRRAAPCRRRPAARVPALGRHAGPARRRRVRRPPRGRPRHPARWSRSPSASSTRCTSRSWWTAARSTPGPASASPPAAGPPPRPTSCSATPTSPCTRPRPTARAASRCSSRPCTTGPSTASPSEASSSARSSGPRSPSPTSRSCASTRARSWPSRRWPAGRTPSGAPCHPASSCPSPRTPGLIVPLGKLVLERACTQLGVVARGQPDGARGR